MARKKRVFRSLTFAFVAFAGYALVPVHAEPVLRLIGSTDSPVEKRILLDEKRLASINASVDMDAPQFIAAPSQALRRFRNKIEPRLQADLAKVYKKSLEKEDATYLLLARKNGKYLVYVVRVRDIRQDGTYAALEGLIYEFPAVNDEPTNVFSTTY